MVGDKTGMSNYRVIREFKLRVIRQTPGKEKFYGIRNNLAVLKLKYIIILSTQERRYETKTFNENFARKVRTCRLPFPEMRSLNSLITL
jgi:hypothetical protein